jgi:hypothetical protein
MAETCCLKRDTVISAINELEERGFLKVLRIPGRGSNYEILPMHCWTGPKERPVSKMDRSKRETALVSKMDHTGPKEGPPPVQKGDRKVSNEGIQLRSPKKECDRFDSEQEVIRFVFSDTACRELQCLGMDARWFWNCMTEQCWHRDSKEKIPIKDVKATCRKWMSFDSRPSAKQFRYKNEEHREQWRQECRLNRDQTQTEML